MKIISLGPAHPLRGGIANFNEAFTINLQKNGHACQIVSYSLQYPNFLFPGKTQFAGGAPPAKLEVRPMLNSINPLNWIKTGRYIAKQKPNILFVHFWMPFFSPALGTINRIVRKNKHTEIIAVCHNITPHETRIGDKQQTSFFLKSCDSFICMSEAVQNDLKKFRVKGKLVLTPHPLYDIFGDKAGKAESREQIGVSSNEKLVLSFGMVRKYKGLDLLLKAMADERLEKEGVKLLIAGEFYDNPQYYYDIIDRLKLRDRVLVKDEFISNDKLRYFFCASDIIAQTYHSATQSGITQIAYHFDRPMLVTNVGGLAEIVPNQKVGYVCEKDATEIADAILDFYVNKKEIPFSKNIEEEKKRFSWDIFSEKAVALGRKE